MTLTQQLIFMISSVGVLNGVALSAYLLFSKSRNPKQITLAFLVLALSIRIAKSVFLYFNPALEKPFLQLGLTACFFIGPLCLAYVAIGKKALEPYWKFWPLGLAVLATISVTWVLFFPYQPHGPEWTIAVRTIYFQWLAFLSAATLVMALPVLRQRAFSALREADSMEASVLIGCWIVWGAFFFSHYTSYIAAALSFTFITYVSVLLLLARKKVYGKARSVPYQGAKISQEEARATEAALTQLMDNEKIFQDPNLSLPRVAKRLGVSPQRLSQILNDNMQVSFTNYVNMYRVENAKKLLTEDYRLSMDDVIEACGFNTQSTFYKAFKSLTQTTPAKFRTAQKS